MMGGNNMLSSSLNQSVLTPYKNYTGSVHANMEGRFYYGSVDGNEDLYYEAENKEQLQLEFQSVIDMYVASLND